MAPLDASLRALRAAVEDLRAQSGPALTRLGFEFDDEQLLALLSARSLAAATALLVALAEWLQFVSRQNLDGVTLTPVLIAFFTGAPPDASPAELLQALEDRRAATRAGDFDRCDKVQRDLEFHRFLWVYSEELSDTSGDWGYYMDVSPEPDRATAYRMFAELPAFPADRQPFDPRARQSAAELLTQSQRREAERAGHEAHGLLAFVRRFRAATPGPILVVGNDRYG